MVDALKGKSLYKVSSFLAVPEEVLALRRHACEPLVLSVVDVVHQPPRD